MSNAKSYSRYTVHKQCGAKYRYKYIERLPVEDVSGPAAQRGTNIHAAVEAIVNQEATTFPEEYSFLANYVPFFTMLNEKGAVAELEFNLDENWDSVPSKTAAWIHGFIDIIVPPPEPGPLYIYELKTGKVYDDHVEQRHFYGTVALSMWGEADEARVIGTYLDQGVNEENLYPRSLLRSYQYMWKQRMERMDVEETWVPRPGFQCRWCPYAKDAGGPCKFSSHK